MNPRRREPLEITADVRAILRAFYATAPSRPGARGWRVGTAIASVHGMHLNTVRPAVACFRRHGPHWHGVTPERWTLEQLHLAVQRLGLGPGVAPNELRSILSAAAVTV